MIPIKFNKANKNLLKPQSMNNDDCRSLWVQDTGKTTISCWGFSFIERIKILFGYKLFLTILGGKTQPPINLEVHKEDK